MSVEELESTALLRMAGELDMATAGQVMDAVDEVDLDGITLLVLDLQDVEFLDLSVLRAIFGARDRCEAHGVHLTVMSPRGAARRVFLLTRAHEVLDIVDAGTRSGR